jgi:glycosyltransferase involved in cell wall biosynthesis
VHTDDEKRIKETLEFVKPFQKILDLNAQVVRKKQGNRSHPLNVALKKLDSEYVSFLDHDDIYYPHFGSHLIDLMEKEKATFVFGVSIKALQEEVTDKYGNSYLFTKNKSKFKTKEFNVIEIFLDNFIPFNTFVVNRALIDDMFFDENLTYLEDWDFLRRITLKDDFVAVQSDKPISEYRVRNDHTDTFSNENEDVWIKCREMIDEKQGREKICISIEDITKFRNKYFNEMALLGERMDKMSKNRGYMIWDSIVNNKLLKPTLVKVVREIRHILRD